MENMTPHERFSGVLGEDYNLFAKSVSYYDQMQDLVGKIIAEFAHDSDKNKLTFFEAGTGTGLTTIRIVEAGSKIHVIAVDNERKMLDQARKVLSDFSDRITFIETDLLEAFEKQPDESVDGFVSGYTIHNLPPEYRNQVFPEIKRILKKGGIFINADKYALDNPEAHQKTLKEQILAFNIYNKIGRPDVKEEWTKHYLADEKIKITESEQFAILEQLGFSNIKKPFRERMDAIIVATRT